MRHRHFDGSLASFLLLLGALLAGCSRPSPPEALPTAVWLPQRIEISDEVGEADRRRLTNFASDPTAFLSLYADGTYAAVLLGEASDGFVRYDAATGMLTLEPVPESRPWQLTLAGGADGKRLVADIDLARFDRPGSVQVRFAGQPLPTEKRLDLWAPENNRWRRPPDSVLDTAVLCHRLTSYCAWYAARFSRAQFEKERAVRFDDMPHVFRFYSNAVSLCKPDEIPIGWSRLFPHRPHETSPYELLVLAMRRSPSPRSLERGHILKAEIFALLANELAQMAQELEREPVPASAPPAIPNHADATPTPTPAQLTTPP